MRKIFEKSEKLFQVYIIFEKGAGDSVDSNRTSLVAVINEVVDMCDYIEHLNLSPTSPLVVLKKNLFLLKLQIKYGKKEATISADLPEKKKIISKTTVIAPAPMIVREKKIEGNRQRILDFICHFPNTRTKEIIDEFTTLSQRTVKRTLKELVADGLLQKRSEANAVFYFPSNVN